MTTASATAVSTFWGLPQQRVPIIGREKELAAAGALLLRDDVPLLTLTGPGGTGKTRLALQLATNLLGSGRFEDGVFFINLAPITDHSLVAPTIAHALGIQETGGLALLDVITDYLHDKRLLLVLDNFEHVADAGTVVARLLASSPHLKVLATSREVLHIYGEHDFPVPPLSLPPTRPLPSLEQLARYEGVRLFGDRAMSVKPEFQLTNDNAQAVAEICLRLDGLPLAIELAAARVRLMPAQAILTRLQDRLSLLTGGARDLPARQQTIRNAIAWSYDLLNEGEKQLFARMAVFQGGRTLEAIEVVCNAEGDLQVDVLEGVGSLLNKSLVQEREGRDGAQRFWMLETIHEYAREKLQESGEADALQKEHALHFMKLAEEAEPHLAGAGQVEWLDRLEDELDNLRALLRWASQGQQHEGKEWTKTTEKIERVEIGLRAAAIWRFWDMRGYTSEGREWLGGLLAWAAIPDRAESQGSREPVEGRSVQEGLELRAHRAKALNAAGVLAYRQGDYTAARSFHEESLALRRELDDKMGIAASLGNLGILAQEQGDLSTARSLLEESLALFRELGVKWGIANQLNNLGNVALAQEDFSKARPLFEESVAVRREIGDRRGIATSLVTLGIIAREQGDYSTASSLFDESLALFRELNDKWGIATSLINMGNVALEQGKLSMARSLCEESLALRKEIGDMRGVAHSLAGLGAVAVAVAVATATVTGRASAGAGADRDAFERGAKVLGAAEAILESTGGVLDIEDRLPFERAKAGARARLGEEQFGKAIQEGRTMNMEEAIALALAPLPEVEHQLAPTPTEGYPNNLSRREVEVLRLVAQGMTDAQVAEQLFLSVRTVENHMRNIYSKIGVSTRSAATRFALDHHLA